jgi:tetratricopeptide (TPR) repeat protein
LAASVLLLALLLVQPAPFDNPADRRPRAGRHDADLARDAYKHGLALFERGQQEQALLEFQKANELSPSPANLVMMGNCEYHLGRFKEARAHYEQYLKFESKGQPAEAARLRIDAINRRQAVVDINASVQPVDVVLERLDGDRQVVTGEAPNLFRVSAGRWRVTVKKPRYLTETREFSVDSVDTRPMFFAMVQMRGRLEIQTHPPGATLYVRGNRARNPYAQDVEPGAYEIFAEATDYEPRGPETYYVAPGEKRVIPFQLHYVQRSGRPELIGFWTAAGALLGGLALQARLSSVDADPSPNVKSVAASASVIAGAALVGGVAGALTARATMPSYIRDNQALFRIGAAWIGAVEGATVALSLRTTAASAFFGTTAGLAAGAVGGTLLDDYSPTYGRVALIQSAAALGALAGALSVPALQLKPLNRTTPRAVLVGLNVGLVTGLAAAYLPNQEEYGPPWQRVLLVDLAIVAGVTAGALFNVVSQCLSDNNDLGALCAYDSQDRNTARFALAGGAVGLVAGWLLTGNYVARSQSTLPQMTLLPVPTVLPVEGPDRRTRAVPALGAHGRF